MNRNTNFWANSLFDAETVGREAEEALWVLRSTHIKDAVKASGAAG